MMPQRKRKPRFPTVPVATILRELAGHETRVAQSPKRILSISYDHSLMLTREMLLEREGYEVRSTADMEEALGLADSGEFDLVIIGQTIPPDERADAASKFRKRTSARILALRLIGQLDAPGVENYLYEGPEGLLRTLRRVLHA